MEGESRPLILIRTLTLGRTERVAKGAAQGSAKGGGRETEARVSPLAVEDADV